MCASAGDVVGACTARPWHSLTGSHSECHFPWGLSLDHVPLLPLGRVVKPAGRHVSCVRWEDHSGHLAPGGYRGLGSSLTSTLSQVATGDQGPWGPVLHPAAPSPGRPFSW